MTASPAGRRLRVCAAASWLLFCLASSVAAADVCLSIDETRDMFSPQERSAALLILARQFEVEGERIVPPACVNQYVLSHVQLGTTITISLSGPRGQRDATARGIDDVPAVYSQMVRSLLRDVPMTGPGVVDRGNVSNAQADTPNRIHADSLFYFHLGYAAVFADHTFGGPSVGFIGYRRELDSFGIDVSLFNMQYSGSGSSSYYGPGPTSGGQTGTWMKLAFLRFTAPKSSKSPYFGGGLSWSTVNLDTNDNGSGYNSSNHWSGNGLQGEILAGYELGRASGIRVFVQTDVGLPFYNLSANRYVYSNTPPYATYTSTDHQYAPSLAVSLGVGWQRGGK